MADLEDDPGALGRRNQLMACTGGDDDDVERGEDIFPAVQNDCVVLFYRHDDFHLTVPVRRVVFVFVVHVKLKVFADSMEYGFFGTVKFFNHERLLSNAAEEADNRTNGREK